MGSKKNLFNNLVALKAHEKFLEKAQNAYLKNKKLSDGQIIK